VTLLAPGPLEPASPATQLVDVLSGPLDLAVGLAPVAVPFILAVAAIAWVLERFGVAGRVEQHDEALTMNRRLDLRRRFSRG